MNHKEELQKGRDYALRVLEVLDQQVVLDHLHAEVNRSTTIADVERYAELRRDLQRKAHALTCLHKELDTLVDRAMGPSVASAPSAEQRPAE